MNGVSKITSAENVMLVSFQAVPPSFVPKVLLKLADAGIVVDMISQTAPAGGSISVSFTTGGAHFEQAIKAIGTGHPGGAAPMISSGYSKINLFGEEMVHSVGVAARALATLSAEDIELFLVTTSDLDISLLVRQEDADVALAALQREYVL